MADEIKPIFTADLDDLSDIGLLKKYFGKGAIDEAFGEDSGYREILENAAMATIEQAYNKLPPHTKERYEQLQEEREMQAAIRRQTRKPEPPELTGTQLSLFDG